MRFQILDRSNYVAWPKAGGVDDQEPEFLTDLSTYLSIKAYYDYDHPDGPIERLPDYA